jgi:transglutaminase-like putative cysteine protease
MEKRYGFITRKIVVVLTVAVLAFAQTAAAFGAVFERQFSYFPQEAILVRVDGAQFFVENLPARAEFDYGCIEFLTPSGKSVGEEWLRRAADNSMGVDTARFSDGLYTVSFYYSAERGSTYTAYFSDNDVQLRIENGEGSLVAPIMYERNAAFHNAGRMDLAALSAYLGPSYGVQSDDPAILALAAELTAGLADDYDKARAIHDWVAGNIWYDRDAVRTGLYDDNTALGALRLGYAVCEGYAKLNAALLRAAGIPAKFVYGYALGIDGNEWPSKALSREDSNHAWNEAFIGGRWVIIDTTWDSGNRYENGRRSENDGLLGYRYFDAVPEAFSADHATTDPEWELWWLAAAVPAPASPFKGSVFVNGVPASPGAYNIGGSNYFKLRDIAAMLAGTGRDFDVGWDGASKTVSIRTDGAYIPDGTELGGSPAASVPAALPEVTLTIDGVAVCMAAYNIGGSNYFKLRDMGESIGFSVAYDAAANAIHIETDEGAPDRAPMPEPELPESEAESGDEAA